MRPDVEYGAVVYRAGSTADAVAAAPDAVELERKAARVAGSDAAPGVWDLGPRPSSATKVREGALRMRAGVQ
jgi:hypothetical protein